jgi:hypothetical protein
MPRGKRAELLQWLERVKPARIGQKEWTMLRVELDPVSGSTLRRLLRDSGVPLGPLVEGVRQENFDALESSLLNLLAEYESGDATMQATVRGLIIEAKDHARWAARNPEKRGEKQEMSLWMLTWLENPPLFPQWVKLRRQAQEKK